jgi:NitT/TauT family transport system ATP-binding protein
MKEVPSETAAVCAEQIQFSYSGRGADHKPILLNLRFTVEPGEWVGIIGPSGCGKSTLLKLITGLETAQSGQLRVLGHIPGQENSARRIGVAFQEQALIPWLSAQRNVELPARDIAGDSLGKAKALLSAFGLGGDLEALPSELSGGMRARVALARALIHRPELVLLDEPFSSLDEITAVGVCCELLALRATGPESLLIVSHNLEAIARLADKCLCFFPNRNIIPEMVDLQRFGPPVGRTSEQISAARASLLSIYV